MGFRHFLILCLISGLAFTGYAYVSHHAQGPLVEPKTVLIPRGAGFRGTTEILTNEGVIAQPLFFKTAAVLTGSARRFKAGEYAFEAGVSASDVMAALAKGEVVVHKVTAPEGWRSADILNLLEEESLLTGDLEGEVKEGELLPETYHFTYGDTRQMIVERMQLAMDKTMAELWPTRQPGLPYTTPEEAMVMASIVERETGVPAERERVAAVFVNRLKLGMRLQADPTVVYAIERDKGLLSRPLTTNDLGYDSPYNTYVYVGLPPAPICNPGRASIEAALNPLQTKELYFVATGDGGHFFAETLAEHNANVKRYRESLKRRK